jgi:hypothetical protein
MCDYFVSPLFFTYAHYTPWTVFRTAFISEDISVFRIQICLLHDNLHQYWLQFFSSKFSTFSLYLDNFGKLSTKILAKHETSQKSVLSDSI